IISMTQRSQYLNSKFDVLSYAYLSPLFFASIGLQVTLPEMTPAIIWFSVLLIVVAVLTKVVGCGLGAKLCHYQNYQAARIGVGMISRGEVALIVASKGMALGLMGNNFLGPVILMVVATTIVTPILLKFVFRWGPANTPPVEKGFSETYAQLGALRSGIGVKEMAEKAQQAAQRITPRQQKVKHSAWALFCVTGPWSAQDEPGDSGQRHRHMECPRSQGLATMASSGATGSAPQWEDSPNRWSATPARRTAESHAAPTTIRSFTGSGEEHHKEIAQSHQQRQQHKAEGEGEQRVDKGGPKAHAFQVKEGEEHVG
ncbi:MAG: cation:proton antiporter, partial [Acutalibacter sp.]